MPIFGARDEHGDRRQVADRREVRGPPGGSRRGAAGGRRGRRPCVGAVRAEEWPECEGGETFEVMRSWRRCDSYKTRALPNMEGTRRTIPARRHDASGAYGVNGNAMRVAHKM